ncbi:MAG: flavodoxin family protein [Clostridia bacterium]|nr:flavodoxin family protein [Clostridia bacterium]
MKVLLINGSPKETGCTYTALCEVAKTLEGEGIHTEIISVGKAPIQGCIGCLGCVKSGEGKCVFSNDLVNTVIEKAKEADGFVIGSPVHYAAASGAITSLMDRVCYAGGKNLMFKPAASIVSCRRGGASATFDQLNKYFSILHMPIVSSNYWNQVHGNTPEEVLKDEEGMQTMRQLGRNMAWLLKAIEAGKNAGISLPEVEPKIKTNYIR